MSILEAFFDSAVLDVVVPDTRLEYPPTGASDDWLSRLKQGDLERKQAFFDEKLGFLLTVRIEHPEPADEERPPADLLSFLAHLQVSLDASYISPAPVATPEIIQTSRLSAPPRTASMGRVKPKLSGLSVPHPSIYPPNTPNPTPSATGLDTRYLHSQGTPLVSHIWGQNLAEDAFSLLWSQEDKVWVAVYRLCVSVAFLRLPVTDPLLCLTVSATLREKAQIMVQQKHPLLLYLTGVGGLAGLTSTSPTVPKGKVDGEASDDEMAGFEEVNLFEGLAAGPTFPASGPGSIHLPSTRLGSQSRQAMFTLAPANAPPTPSPILTARIAYPTLRKSFRRTLETVSGFRVRMRTVFVPYVLLPETTESLDPDEAEEERERREAGNEERTVVLCVEVENTGESGSGVGFAVEKVDVNIGGEGASATLIGWGEGGFGKEAEKKAFPLLVGSLEQYNLLYAVSFLRTSEDTDGLTLTGRPDSTADLQRSVTILIHGKPFQNSAYPTNTFSSRWNCVLDLTAHQTRETAELADSLSVEGGNDALPEPASPFPMSSPRTAGLPATDSLRSPAPFPTIAGTSRQRFSLPAGRATARASVPPNFRASFSNQQQHHPPNTPSKLSYTPPSATSTYIKSPTTYEAPASVVDYMNHQEAMGYNQPPPTPAYPAYAPNSLAVPPTPMHSQMALSNHQSGSIGPSIEIRRGISGAQTPGPTLMGGSFGEQQEMMMSLNEPGLGGGLGGGGEPIIVSIGMIPVTSKRELGKVAIYPLDQFTLDIFVFNQSTRTRRFEVSYPDRRRRRRLADADGEFHVEGDLGVLPLDNRVRVGPLLPSTCQSVRMEFLALTPGVHSIDTITLTDTESGFSMNLRSVMDIVVHERLD